jgi:hypothetical protein
MRYLLIVCLLVLPFAVQARPVSYKGGTMVMLENNIMENSALVNYTYDPKYALGYRILYDRNTASTFHGAQFNALLKRWNNPDSQANIYWQSAIGLLDRQSEYAGNEFQPAGLTGIEADWEDRRFYVSYENRIRIADDNQWQNFQQSARMGIAPYVAEAGSLHTWLMLQFDHRPEQDDSFTTTPLVRMFYDTYLFEAGYNVDEQAPLLNFTTYF